MQRLIFAALFAILLSAPVAADQTDTRLEPLFAELKAAASITDARYIEREIWAIWSLHGSNAEIDLRFQRGVLLMNAGRLEEATRIFSKIVEIDPDFAEAWNKRATLLYLTGDLAGSVRDIERTLALEPRHFGALSGLGLIYEQIESADGAIKAFTAALEINPHMPWIVERLEALEEEQEGEPLQTPGRRAVFRNKLPCRCVFPSRTGCCLAGAWGRLPTHSNGLERVQSLPATIRLENLTACKTCKPF